MSPDADAIGQTADALGIDSLVAVDLRSWFMKELSVDMPVLKIISGATIGELLERARELLDPAMTPALGTELTPERMAALEQAKANKASAQMPTPTPDPKLGEPEPKAKPAPLPTAKSPGDQFKPPASTSNAPKPSAPKAQSTASAPTNPNSIAPRPAAGLTAPRPVPVTSSLKPVPPAKAPEPPQTARAANTEVKWQAPISATEAVSIPSAALLTAAATKEVDGFISGSTDLSFSEPEESVSHINAVSSSSSVSSFEKISPASVKESGVQRTLPMSFGQAGFWFLRSYLEDPTTFNVTTSIHLQGSLDEDRLAQAVATIGQRHESLRTRFFTDDKNQPMQAVLESSVLRLERKNVVPGREVSEAYDRLRSHVYDLEKGETLRIVLLKMSPVSYQILLGYHHINMDGVSFEIFFSDLEKAYNANSSINSKVLQYPDFATKQRKEFAEGEWSSELNFWKSEFQNLPSPLPLLPLSTLPSRISLTKYNSDLTSYRVTPELSAQIYDTCKKMKVSPFQFYLTVYKVLITRFVEVDDICIGVADANRNDLDVQQSLGCYLNLLPIRFDNRAVTFSEAVKEAKTKAQQAYANSKVPFDVLLKELNVPRSSNRSPLFQVFLNYRQGVAEKRTFAGCDSEWDAFDGGQIAYDLSLDIVDNAGGDALLRLFSQTALYSPQDGGVLMKSFVKLLDAFSRNPAARLTRPLLHSKDDAQNALILGKGKYILRCQSIFHLPL
jgi:hybrid polyketide synthase / nonribosomal peptide synthetase ACE1